MASREVRKVPADWAHPKDASGKYMSLQSAKKYQELLAWWEEEKAHWEKGEAVDYSAYPEIKWKPKTAEQLHQTYEEAGDVEWPDPKYFMPSVPPEQATHYQLYELVNETPLSPPMKTPEALAHWLADNKASAFANETATYEEWLNMIHVGHSGGGRLIPHQDGTVTIVSDVRLMAQVAKQEIQR